MPWTADLATAHTKAANTPRLRQLWAKVANERLEAGADDATAIREANAAVNQARGKGRGYRMIALGLAFWTLGGCQQPPPCGIIVVNGTVYCQQPRGSP